MTDPPLSPEPDVASAHVIEYVRGVYGLDARHAEFLAGVSDGEVTAYRVDCEEGPHFLKLRRDAPPPPLARYLAGCGITQVLAPLSPRDSRLSNRIGERFAILYPFVEGENAFRRPLSDEQWTALGAIVRAIHDVDVPPSISDVTRRETYSDEWRVRARRYLADPPTGGPDDAVAHKLIALLRDRRTQLERLADHAGQLAASLRRRKPPFVPCHADLHAGNVLVGDDGSLTIVDWDDLLLAPRERDLMFVGAGIGHAWNRPAEAGAFYRGYGEITVDAEALAYYRCERFVVDVAAFCDQLLLEGRDQGSHREDSLRKFASAFGPNDVVEIAERTFAELSDESRHHSA